MSADASTPRLRIGELAQRAGVTTRTIRYYEERGLLGSGQNRSKGDQRLYSDADLTRLLGLIRLRDLLGLSLEELVGLAEADEARAGLRAELAREPSDRERARILGDAIPLVERQLELVRSRQTRLAEFADELAGKLHSLHERRAQLAVPERG
jgi:DNA-binding transcriptional MerR regulator